MSDSIRPFVARPASVKRPEASRRPRSRRPSMTSARTAFGQVVDPADDSAANAAGEGAEHVRLGAADPLGDQGGDVAVPTVLAEHVGRVPEPRDGLFGHREGAEPGVHDPSLRPGAGRGLGEEIGCARQPRSLDEVAEDPLQRRHAALLTSGVRRLGCGRGPDLGDVARHLTLGEAVEGSVHHLGRDLAERRRPSSEIAVPVVAETERRHRVVGLRGEEVTSEIGSASSKRRWATGPDAASVSSPVVVTAPSWAALTSATNSSTAIRQGRTDHRSPAEERDRPCCRDGASIRAKGRTLHRHDAQTEACAGRSPTSR